VLAAFAGIALLVVTAHSSSTETATTTSMIQPIPISFRAQDARDMAQLEQDHEAFYDGLATAEAQRQADAQAAAAAEHQRQERAAARAAQRQAQSQTQPAPAVSARGDGSSAAAAVRQYFGDVFDQAWGSANNYGVTTCESGHDPSIISSGGGNWGLFQINTSHRADFEAYTGHPWSDVLDPYLNAYYARRIYDNAGGWNRDWSCAWAAYR